MSRKIGVHCDGSCMQTVGGIGIVISTSNSETLICRGSFENTTNNRMELLAFIYSVHYLQKFLIDKTEEVEISIYADSKYLVDGYNDWIHSWLRNNWRSSTNQQVLNIDLWQKIHHIKNRFNYSLFWEKAHDKNLLNNKADLLAKSGAGNNSYSLSYNR